MRIGPRQLDVHGCDTLVALGRPSVGAGVAAEVLVGGQVLSRQRVTFDYSGRRFDVADAGPAPSRGLRIPMAAHPSSGFPHIDMQIDGEAYGMLLDTGASSTMVSRALLDRLAAEHPTWPRATGAVGAANMACVPGQEGERLLRLPSLRWGPFELPGVTVVSRRTGTFEERLSRWTAGPVVGALGGNVLRHVFLDLDSASGAVSLQPRAQPDPDDMDLVGLAPDVRPNGLYVVAGVADTNGPFVVEAVRPGDRLLAIDGFDVAARWPRSSMRSAGRRAILARSFSRAAARS